MTVKRANGDVTVAIAGRLNILLGKGAFPNGLRASVGKVVEGEKLGANVLFIFSALLR